jgi:DNA mismatch repair protein MutS2
MGGNFAETALAAIEFPAALRCVSQYAVTAQGARRVESRRPASDPAIISAALERADAMRRLLDEGEEIAPLACGEPESALSRLRVEGSVLDGEALCSLLLLLEAARATALKLRRAAVREPALSSLLPPPLPEDLEPALVRALEPGGRLRDEASRELLRLRRELVAARAELVATLERILGSVDSRHRGEGAAVTLRSGRYVIPVRASGRARLGGIVHDESATQSTLFVEPPEAIELNNRLRSIEAGEAREVQRVLRELTALLRPHAAPLEAAFVMIVETDDAWARGRFASLMRAPLPVIAPAEAELALRDAAHPLLFQPGASVVRFDLVLVGGERTVLVSGPNTGGKTVLLKAAGLAVAMAQSGIIPPLGPGSVIPVRDAIFADIGDRQSIMESLSTFSAHVATLKDVLDRAGPGSLVLLDELGTGTDPAEGAALAAAVLVSLTARGALTVATTHLGALKDLAAHSPGIVNASLQFDAATLGPTYRFAKGVPGRSYALAIARRLGVGAEVLADAESRVSDVERKLDSMLAAAEQRAQELARRIADLESRELDLANQAARVAAAETLIRQRGEELSRGEKELERRTRSGMREHLLAARAEVERAIALARDGREREARRALEEQIAALDSGSAGSAAPDRPAAAEHEPPGPASLARGTAVRIRSLGVEGEIESVRGEAVTVLVRGRRVRVKAADLAAAAATTRGRR